MRKLTILVIAILLATAYAGSDALAKERHKASATKRHKPAATQPVEHPITRLPVAPDTFRA
ncbi:hypothetical protein [Bradyrhizobium sp. ARR65]|uniref:hypothetical protein n=1 Tax=Bradyrhizobium sp. ARR65 TaxID=1040989 RepID=UPI000464A444|nr:hypothetical protein [Bradyrhizobium sp. ARR65]